MKKKNPKPSYKYRIAVIIWTAIAVWGYYLSKNDYFPAPFDTPSDRSVRLIISSPQTLENTPQIEREDMIYSVEYSLHVSIDGILNPNQSENVCLLPEVTGRLRPNARMSGTQISNFTLCNAHDNT